jgi:hypothetical protein
MEDVSHKIGFFENLALFIDFKLDGEFFFNY